MGMNNIYTHCYLLIGLLTGLFLLALFHPAFTAIVTAQTSLDNQENQLQKSCINSGLS